MAKYADDCYLLVPACNTSSLPQEMAHISDSAQRNGLKLNSSKTKELLVTRKSLPYTQYPPPIAGIDRVPELVVLGVTLQRDIGISVHVQELVAKGHQCLYALKVLKAHGLTGAKLFSVCKATLISKLTYAAPSWWGFCSTEDKIKLQAIIRKPIRWEVLEENAISFECLCAAADNNLFSSITNNPHHVLTQLLSPLRSHSLRPRSHNFTLPTLTTLNSKNFFYRMLYKETY